MKGIVVIRYAFGVFTTYDKELIPSRNGHDVFGFTMNQLVDKHTGVYSLKQGSSAANLTLFMFSEYLPSYIQN